MKIRTLASGLTHLLFIALIALAAAKSAQDSGRPEAEPGAHQPVRAAEARLAEQTGNMVDAGQSRTLPASADAEVERAAEAPADDEAAQTVAPEEPAPRAKREQTEPAAKPLSRNERLMRRLVSAYPAFLAGYEDNAIIWHDGTRMPFDDGREKTFKQRLTDPDLEDQFYAEYPRGLRGVPPLENVDPGRVRYEPFFEKMYGNCKDDRRAVSARLKEVVWLPENYGKTLRVTKVNGVADALQKVSNKLDKLPQRFMKYLRPSAGTYHCRTIAGTERFSVHAFGAAVDINAKYGDYWRWSGAEPGETLVYRNRIPWEIVEIFEQHGFIWGGKWYHYDTLHFEYRPELLNGPAPEPVSAPAPAPLPAKRPVPEQRAAR
ncbi:M15 family metallopeptidase [Dichotomicrobium thermohalophilum]|uniref:D-alanyl-D-alanine carboxypeptidase-like protein n=1 Tax=Dichotomicrobium thermohalophilum TaxID=933063 RepID=A0A397Q6G5_9HYPH|nr:M15 family metallopeptidase [Dichotomicrobium thermohalophilum]RIA56638.1 D-alanyl-D-alanine carboxypeptidase-like protein [Dichotomicrobium thermohalophilum]